MRTKNLIANIVTSQHYVPSYGMYEERQRIILRKKRLTYRGAERVFKREAREVGETWNGCVIRVETAIWECR